MKNISMRSASRILFALLTVAGISSNASAGYGNLIELNIKNGDHTQSKFTIMPGNCSYIQAPLELDLAPGQSMRIGFTHDAGSRCDGTPGVFELLVEGNTLKTYFEFSENGPLWLATNPPTTAYQGNEFKQLGGGSQGGGEFLWESKATPQITAGKPQGSWGDKAICQQICDELIAQEITNSSTTVKTVSEETTKAVAVALEAGVEFSGVSAKTSVTMSQEQKVGRQLSQEMSSGKLKRNEKKIVLTLEQMEEKNIFAIWQWVVSAPMSDGTSVTITTNKFTCTPGDNPPTYLPGSPEDLVACRKKPAGTASAPAAPAAEVQLAVAAVGPATVATAPAAAPAGAKEVLVNGARLLAGSSLKSPNGRFVFTQQTDGNTCLYDGTKMLWCNMINGKGAAYLIMQTDGNLCAYTAANAFVWCTMVHSYPDAQASVLKLQDDGNLVVYSGATAHWSSNTTQP